MVGGLAVGMKIHLQKEPAMQPSALGGLCKAKANQFFRTLAARRSSLYINFALRTSLRHPFYFLRIFVPCNPLTFIAKISKMKFFGRGKALATEVAVGGPSDSDNTTEKHDTPGVDADALERIPSQNVQDGVKKVEAVTLTWTRNQLILAYGWQELHSYHQSCKSQADLLPVSSWCFLSYQCSNKSNSTSATM